MEPMETRQLGSVRLEPQRGFVEAPLILISTCLRELTFADRGKERYVTGITNHSIELSNGPVGSICILVFYTCKGSVNIFSSVSCTSKGSEESVCFTRVLHL